MYRLFLRPARRLVSLVALLSLALSPLSSAPSPRPAPEPSPASPSTATILVDTSNLEALRRLAAQGAQPLADYGAFSLWRVSPTQAAALSQLPGVTLPTDFDSIPLRGLVIDTRPGAAPPAIAPTLAQALAGGAQFWMVQFVGPIQDAWLDHLSKLGLQTVIYLPHHAYVLWGDAAAIARLQTWQAAGGVVQWTGPFHPHYRLEPSLQSAAASLAAEQFVNVTVQLYAPKAVALSLAPLLAIGGQVYQAPAPILNFVNVSLQLPAGRLAEVAGWPDVFNIEPWSPPVLLDEGQGQIVAGNVISSGGNIIPAAPGYLAWLASQGFTTTAAAYPLVSVVDDGIDDGSVTPLHPDFYTFGMLTGTSRLLFNVNCTNNSPADSGGGHGNLNAGLVGAYNDLTGAPHVDANGYRIGLGISPYGRMGGVKIFNNAGSLDISECANSQPGVVLASYTAGAAFTSNSWGQTFGTGVYDASAQAYDALTRDAAPAVGGNQEMLHIFAAGNSGGSGANTVGSPGTAKNVLTVGATKGVRDNGVADGCGFTSADDADDIASFSGRGPTDDGRVKPDLMAPGVHIQGPASQAATYAGNLICAGQPNPPNIYYPPSQTLYTWSSGTSHSTPAVAGAASLAYEYYGRVLTLGQTPNPAMLKALLVNSPRYLNGAGTGGTLPSNNQGWGDVNLGTLFDGLARNLLDQTFLLSATGQVYSATGTVVSSTQPFRVSLVWTDAPGSTLGSSVVNNLDLQVTVGGNTYKGNVFSGPNSITGGAFDPLNNVENVFLPAGLSGPFQVSVTAANVAGDGVPGSGDATDQDFALVIYNGSLSPQVLLSLTSQSVSDAAGDNDGVVEPGETIALDLGLTNSGSLLASGVTGELAVALGSASMISPTATYPDLAPGVTATNTTPFLAAISAGHDCGQPLTFVLTTTYNVSNTIAFTLNVPVGLPLITLAEDFDSLAPPALPAGWTASALSGSPTPWRTVITNTDTTPNAVFAPDINTVSDNVLLTPPFTVTTPSAQLSFRNRYVLEAGVSEGYDGGVLEIKIGPGSFTDILTAGGSFVSGAYTHILSDDFDNPLAGRAAWSGNSGGYQDTVVNLPASALGQTVQLRWRLGTDSSAASQGQWIDTVTLAAGAACHAVHLPLLLR